MKEWDQRFYLENIKTDQFIKVFRYDKGSSIEGWKDIRKSKTGDCNDFALSVLLLECDGWLRSIWMIITMRAVFWLVRSPSNIRSESFSKHIALWHHKKGWIDSTNRKWRSSVNPHQKRIPLLFPWVLFRVFWGKIY